MAVIRVSGFAGENRALHPKVLPQEVGTLSRNQKPGRGDLRPWKQPATVATVPAGRQTVYRMGRDVASDSSYWLSWPGVVHAVRGFDADDTSERTYFTGDGAPKVTDTTAALAGVPYPTAHRPLGMPAPGGAPTVSVGASGSSGALAETYFYVYTFVNDWGWESAPSPPSVALTRQNDGTTNIGSFSTAPAGNYHITAIRIYRTQATGAAADFYFLREVAYGTDTTTDDNRSLGEVLPTTTWLAPPDDLSCLTPLWGGMLAGISGNAVRFCEAYVPYAWPMAYDAVPPDAKPVGLGVFGQRLLVLTTGRPMLVSGSGPESMDQQPLEMAQACVAPRSVVSMGNGVAWASEDGLCWYGAGASGVVTNGVMTREDWQALVPSSIVGCMCEGYYFGSYSTDGGATRKAFLISPANPSGIYFLDAGYTAMHFDELRDQLFVLDGASVKKWDGGSPMTVQFRSKTFVAGPMNFAAAEVVADAYPVTFRLYADGVLRHTKAASTREPFWLPSGYLARDWQIEIEATTPVQSIALATSMDELHYS